MDDHTTSQNNPYLAPKAATNNISIESPDEIVLADRLTRLGANIIDTLIQLAIALPILFAILYLYFSVESFDDFVKWAESGDFLGNVMGTAIGFAVFVAIHFRLLRSNGQTVGKRICNIKIVRSDGSPADVQRILLYRYLLMDLILLMPVIGNIIVFVGVLLIFRESRKCLHDDIADTIVINA